MQLWYVVSVLLLILPLLYCQESNSTEPDTSTAGTSIADTSIADTSIAGTSIADTSIADTTIADTSIADTSIAGTSIAGTSIADTSIADTSIADTSIADTSIADTSATDTSATDTSTAGTSTAGTSTAGTSTVDTGTADTSTAGTSTVDTGTAGTSTVDTGTADTSTVDTGTADTSTADTSTAGTSTTTSTTAQTGTTALTTAQTGTTTSNTAPTGTTTSTTTPIGTATSTTTPTGPATSTTTPTGPTAPTTAETGITITSTANPTTTTSTTTTTAPSPPILLAQCNFSSSSCLSSGENYVTITNGSQFAEEIRRNSSVQPIAPVSGAPSTVKSDSYKEKCELPYNLSTISNISTNWEMWFCFEDKCPPITDGIPTSCSAGNYGLINFQSNDTSKSISLQAQPPSRIAGEPSQQSLLYYYYITFYNDAFLDRNQTITAYAIDNQAANSTLIDTVSLLNMTKNDWQNRSIDFNFSSTTYTLTFIFTANQFNSIGSATNMPIYFALDNIELVVKNFEPPVPPADSNTNLALILGLSLGLGVPALLGVAAGSAYYIKQKKRKDPYLTEDYALDDQTIYPDYQYVDNDNDISATVF
jgi:hypothetical protein